MNALRGSNLIQLRLQNIKNAEDNLECPGKML